MYVITIIIDNFNFCNTHRLYDQLEEVKQKRAYKAREAQKVDVQARRKEYGSKLLARSKKSS